jgi:hypothetical protein
MATLPTLPLSSIVDVIVEISPIAPSPPSFNQGLILGNSTVIPSYGTNSRVRQYSNVSQMLSDGFTTSSPEYICASMYFSQSPAPLVVWIGRQDSTNTCIQTITSVPAGGTGYVVGEIISIDEGGAQGCLAQVAEISSGAVTVLNLLAGGTGYSGTGPLSTTSTNGVGTGCTVDVSLGSESMLQAAQYCRAANYTWYGLYPINAGDSDVENLAGFAQSAVPSTFLFYNLSDPNILGSGTTDVCSVIKALDYNRAFGLFSTTQGGNAPNNVYAGAAVMGLALGQNTGLANSFYTMKFKSLVGVVAEPMSVNNIGNVEGKNCNLYLSYANGAYTFLEQGVVPNGQFFDEILNLDLVVASIQYSVMNLLTENPSIPQTDPGQTQLIHAVDQALANAAAIGFIATGVWKGVQILKLTPGTPLPLGYLSQSPAYVTQALADRAARKAMPIYSAIIEAGAVHYVTIGVYVQR